MLSVVGVWKILLTKRIPLPVSIPVVLAPPTVNVYVAPIPVNDLEASSKIMFVS